MPRRPCARPNQGPPDRRAMVCVAWLTGTGLDEYVPAPLYGPVQQYLDTDLSTP